MNNARAALFVSLLAVIIPAIADSTCVGILTTDPETGVTHQHPVTFVNCPCNCNHSRWLDNGRCVTCGHAHAASNVIQTAKTNGNFIAFMSPNEAQAPAPRASNWLQSLISQGQEKAGNTTSPGGTSSFSEISSAK